MISKEFLFRASRACGVSCVVIACTLVGCGREDVDKGGAPAPAATRLKDPQLKAELRNQVVERDALQRAQQTIVEKMNAVAAKYNGDLKAAANDPEMVSLIRRARDLETNFASNRAQTAEMIRTRAIQDAAQQKSLKKEVK